MKAHLYESEVSYAVKYVKENNPYAEDWSEQYIRDTIYSLARSLLVHEYETIGSMGVLLVKGESDDDDIVNIEIHLDPFCDDYTTELFISEPETD